MSRKRRVLIYTPIFPFPAVGGSHHRILQMIRYFMSRGFDIHLATPPASWSNPVRSELMWDGLALHILRIQIYSSTLDSWLSKILRKPEGYRFDLKLAFDSLVRRLEPDIILINYASNAYLTKGLPKSRVWIDTHDYFTFSRYLSDLARNRLSSFFIEPTNSLPPIHELLEDCTRQCARLSRAEFDMLESAGVVIAISEEERSLFAKNIGTTVIAFNFDPGIERQADHTPDRAAGLMPLSTGDNPHSVLGAMLLDRSLISRTIAHHAVTATGGVSTTLTLGAWCRAIGSVTYYHDEVKKHAFGLCVACWGTGAQIKQYEFASYGRPIVGYRDVIDQHLWKDGVTALIVSSPDDFAEAVIELAQHQELREQLRQNARELSSVMGERKRRQEHELDCLVA